MPESHDHHGSDAHGHTEGRGPRHDGDVRARARQLVDQSGARVTSARVAVLAELLRAGVALTHQDLHARLQEADRPGLDRVTLYRVLDWLVEVGLAHRVPDPDRVLRFSAQPAGSSAGQHGHFRCQVCHGVFCLAQEPGLPAWLDGLLPPGFHGESLELTVSGRCAACSGQ